MTDSKKLSNEINEYFCRQAKTNEIFGLWCTKNKFNFNKTNATFFQAYILSSSPWRGEYFIGWQRKLDHIVINFVPF
jgi:hypothetical protein